MKSKEIFNYIVNEFNDRNIDYVILHSYKDLPNKFESDIDISINLKNIKKAIKLLNSILEKTDWKIIQYWRHENYAVDCVISNDREFLQVDFCTNYERDGRVLLDVEDITKNRKKHKNFYIPSTEIEFTYILLKKILKKNFSNTSRESLSELINNMNEDEINSLKENLEKYLQPKSIDIIIEQIYNEEFNEIDIDSAYNDILSKTSNIKKNLEYKMFELFRKCERIYNPTGLFVVLLGVDGSGKTTLANEFLQAYDNAFRRKYHYHSRVRVLKDLSDIRGNKNSTDHTQPHSKYKKSNKLLSIVKLNYYLLDYMIGNFVIMKNKIRSSIILVERYFYDYSIDPIRYNLSLSSNFIKKYNCFVKKPDIIFILDGDSEVLWERKKEIPLKEIQNQKEKLKASFINNKSVKFIDTTNNSPEQCIEIMLRHSNEILRNRRNWK